MCKVYHRAGSGLADDNDPILPSRAVPARAGTSPAPQMFSLIFDDVLTSRIVPRAVAPLHVAEELHPGEREHRWVGAEQPTLFSKGGDLELEGRPGPGQRGGFRQVGADIPP